MLKKILVGGLVFVLAASIGLFFWARSVLTQDNVRAALGQQLSKALGQPVEVGGISASIYPRVTVNLRNVEIGQPARIHVQSLDVGTDFRALLSRRIEHGAVVLDGAKIELPLPAFAVGSEQPVEASGEPGAPPVEIVSIDEIALRNVEITSGGRSLRGDVEVVPRGAGVELRKVALTAGGATVDVTGQITDLSGPVGELSVKAGALNFDDLLAFAADFAGGAASGSTATERASTNAGAPPTAAPQPAAGASTMDLTMALDAESATMGGLALQKVSGRAHITPQAVALSPIKFGVFGGSYDGELTLQAGEITRFNVKASMANIDVAAVTKFGGSPDVVTGRLSGKFDISGAGVDPGAVVKSTNGTARVDITNGVVKHLGLVGAIVTATSGRAGALSAASRGAAADEPFARMGATLAIDRGVASTKDLRFESNDVLLSAAGVVHLDGSATALTGQVQLSDQLSQQAGRDLVRYTQEGGRVTLPAAVSGPADNPQVRIDVSSLARRAITNKATEEVKKGLGRIFGR